MMNRKPMFSFLMLLFLLLLSGGCQSTLPQGEWILVWQDDFDGPVSPDPSRWESQEYNRRNNPAGPDGFWDTEDVYLDGEGHLEIRVRKIPDRDGDGDSDAYDYATGMVRSRGRFEQKYGKFEIRCRLPAQPGWWVAFWLMSDTVGNIDGSGRDGTEIDIFEGFGWTDRVQHALHWDGYGEAHQSDHYSRTIPGIRSGYHTFTLEWYESLYVFYIDGKETWRTTAGGVSQVPAYVKVTGEISTEGWATNEYWAHNPEDATYPDYFLIDYVKVYELR
jgi:beta-glucanase (GH16 family)